MTVAVLSEQRQTFRKPSHISRRSQHLSGRIITIDRRDPELLAAGGMSNIDLGLGNEPCVVVTGVELESITPAADVPRQTFRLKQVCSSYAFNFLWPSLTVTPSNPPLRLCLSKQHARPPQTSNRCLMPP